MTFVKLAEEIATTAREFEEPTLLVISKWHGSLRAISSDIIEARGASDEEEKKWHLDDISFLLRSIAVGAAMLLEALGVASPEAEFTAEYERAAAKHPGMTLDSDSHTDETRFYALAEEVGEVASSFTYDNAQGTGHNADTIAEVTQVGALALAWLVRYQDGENR